MENIFASMTEMKDYQNSQTKAAEHDQKKLESPKAHIAFFGTVP